MGEKYADLSDGELQVLAALWDVGPAPCREVMNHLQTRGRRLAYTTVLTFLTRLEQKGYVTSDRSGVAHVFRAGVSREKVRRSRLKDLVAQLYDGAAGPLVLQLVKSQQLTADEIAELQRLIDHLDTNSQPR